MTFRSQPHKIATLADREVWLADFENSEGNVLALMSGRVSRNRFHRAISRIHDKRRDLSHRSRLLVPLELLPTIASSYSYELPATG